MDIEQQDEYRRKREEIEHRLREHDAARLHIEAELKALRHICQHPRAESFTSSDYKGDTDLHFNCPDCGYSRIT